MVNYTEDNFCNISIDSKSIDSINKEVDFDNYSKNHCFDEQRCLQIY